VLFRLDDPSGAVVAQLSVDGAAFWLADESPTHKNFSPESLGGGIVHMVPTTEDPDATFHRAVAAGAALVGDMNNEIRLPNRPHRRPIRPPLGDR